MRGWIGEETPGGSAKCLGGRQRSRKGEEMGAGEKQELADVGMSSPKQRKKNPTKRYHCSIR